MSLFSLANRNVVSHIKNSILILEAAEECDEEKRDIIRMNHLMDIRNCCHNVIRVLDKHLIPFSTGEISVFLYTMKAEFWMKIEESQKGIIMHAVGEAFNAFQSAWEIAQEDLCPTDPLRMKVALGYAIFLDETMNPLDRACKIAREAMEAANVLLNANLLYGTQNVTPADKFATVSTLRQLIRKVQNLSSENVIKLSQIYVELMPEYFCKRSLQTTSHSHAADHCSEYFNTSEPTEPAVYETHNVKKAEAVEEDNERNISNVERAFRALKKTSSRC